MKQVKNKEIIGCVKKENKANIAQIESFKYNMEYMEKQVNIEIESERSSQSG